MEQGFLETAPPNMVLTIVPNDDQLKAGGKG
jgi:hypothetical protein